MKDIQKHDTFLADSVRPRVRRLSYIDGFRFGIGFSIAGLVMGLVLGALTWIIVLVFHLH